jgi:general secretion pathway protein B
LPEVNTAQPRQTATLPTIYEVVADGSIVLPELHLDIHVFSEVPADRFVFINMSKQREQSQLSEGPLVEEITPDGVVLAYRGKSFLLPRD